MEEDTEEGDTIGEMYEDLIIEARDRVEDREDLVEFVALLAKGYENGAFERTDLRDFLEAIWHVLEGLPSLCKNQGRPNPEQPDWRWVGEILVCALYR